MRPRVFPAEDGADNRFRFQIDTGFNEAAGIPRGRRPATSSWACVSMSFNEAAGIPRGRRIGLRWGSTDPAASMRPRVFPAEDFKRPYEYFEFDELQ